MRIATWNVNSLKARLEKVGWWLERARPDVLLLQETKLRDEDAPHEQFRAWGYSLLHHGQGRWNGVAIAARGEASDVIANFGRPLGAPAEADADAGGDFDPLGEARMLAATVGGVRVVSIYAPNGREVGSPFFTGKLAWYARLSSWLAETGGAAVVLAGDFNIAPADLDVWDPNACHGGTHVSAEERAAFERLLEQGFVDAWRRQHAEGERYSWWDYRAGNFHKNFGMRIDHCLISTGLVQRLRWSEIDREARKGKPIPSDHAPVLIDLDEPGQPIDAGWSAAEARFLERRTPKKR
jgi:exodeoxyribonuclease III